MVLSDSAADIQRGLQFGREEKDPPPPSVLCRSVPYSIPFRSVLTLLISLTMKVAQESGAVELAVVEFPCSVISLLSVGACFCSLLLVRIIWRKHARAEEMQKKRGKKWFLILNTYDCISWSFIIYTCSMLLLAHFLSFFF